MILTYILESRGRLRFGVWGWLWK